MSMSQPGRGRISVLLVLDKQAPLVESAIAARERRSARMDIRAAAPSSDVAIDPSYAAVPLGAAKAKAAAAIESIVPQASETFAVRAFIETDDPAKIPEHINGRPVYSDPVIETLLTCRGDPPVGTAADARSKLKVPQLAANGLDGTGVALAIVDFGINLAHLTAKLGTTPKLDAENSWTPDGVTTQPGQHPLKHGTLCAFNALIAAPKATLLDFPILLAGGSIGTTLSVAVTAYGNLLANWTAGFAPDGARKFKALVISNSWGVMHPSEDFPVGHPGRYVDNPGHPFNLQVSALARAGVDIAFAAGNCGADCPNQRCQGRTTETIMGANALADVLTLGGCDTNDARVGYSSQGPAITNMFRQKPDVTAYTHYVGSEVRGPGKVDDGTSTACPVAAGCVAALRSKASPSDTPPAVLFAKLMASARQVGGPPGWNANFGHGIIDPLATASALGLMTGV